MNIYISGISGTGMGPLALMAKSAGFLVSGSDLHEGPVARELFAAGIECRIGKSAQDGDFLRQCFEGEGIDWFVYTSALPEDHPELLLAKKLGVRVSKRDELIAFLIDKLGLLMVAVAGTHGKTTTTAMIIWAALELGIPVSYLVGTTLSFADSGLYNPESKFLIYEADEYDRNFLHFSPWLSAITVVSYDHPDIYPTRKDYEQAFLKFMGQSERTIKAGDKDTSESEMFSPDHFTLAGAVRREDASLAAQAIVAMAEESDVEISPEDVIGALNKFPGSGRRFERICSGVYSDYGHHPEEIKATIDLAQEEADRLGLSGIVAIYEPHQNTRQYEIFEDYAKAFSGVDHLYWLPTYLTRENPELKVIAPEEFIRTLSVSKVAEPAEMDDKLSEKLKKWRGDGYLLLLLTAGPADAWLREVFLVD